MPESTTVPQLFARRLSELREARGWSQQKLADRLAELGVRMDRAAIAKIERGQDAHQKDRARRVSLEEFIALAAALGVSPLSLIGDPKTSKEIPFEVRVAPNLSLPLGFVFAWILGALPLRLGDVADYVNEQPMTLGGMHRLLETVTALALKDGKAPESPAMREALRAYASVGLANLTAMETWLETLKRDDALAWEELHRDEFETQRAELERLRDLLEEKPATTRKGARTDGKRR
jgi:transcriptional regulator with XRE-family HTH domain